MNKTLLMIEDNPDNVKLLTWTLEDEGYEVVTAATAEEGLKELEKREFALILMDISLPGMDGKQATRIIRTDPKYRDLPIIAVTAHAIQGESEKILACGVTELVTKPIDTVKIVGVIAKHLRGEAVDHG